MTLDRIAAKLAGGERLTQEDGEHLFAHPDLHAIGRLANREAGARVDAGTGVYGRAV